ncbi:hypothetical protein FOL47_004594 [Perkinsus chesapeaki]|uniref:Uncharacterized protein n=1 Tax=Perkinsus chesapeaki TaxID=330153 RepID=A0A7J6N1D7_PERCH|nr:hypothetical protein FOL47_004594 [Perkinsus chesapeaki]
MRLYKVSPVPLTGYAKLHRPDIARLMRPISAARLAREEQKREDLRQARLRAEQKPNPDWKAADAFPRTFEERSIYSASKGRRRKDSNTSFRVPAWAPACVSDQGPYIDPSERKSEGSQFKPSGGHREFSYLRPLAATDSDVRLSDFYRPVMVAFSKEGGYESFQGFHTDRRRLRPGRPRSAGQRLTQTDCGAAVPWSELMYIREACEARGDSKVHISTSPPLLKCPGPEADYGPGDREPLRLISPQDLVPKSQPVLLERDALTDDKGDPKPPPVSELRHQLFDNPLATSNKDLVKISPPPKLPNEPNYVPPPPKGTCKVNPRGYVCVAMDLETKVTHELPALPGELLKCYPTVKYTHYEGRLIGPPHDGGHEAPVLPHSESDPDPRYKYHPKSHPSPMARCCNGKITGPWSIHPPPCEADEAYYYWTHAHDHELPIEKFIKHDPAVDDKLAMSTYMLPIGHRQRIKALWRSRQEDYAIADYLMKHWWRHKTYPPLAGDLCE